MRPESTVETQEADSDCLVFPWGPVPVEQALVGSRESAYLRWLTRKVCSGKLSELEKVLGNKPHRFKVQYGLLSNKRRSYKRRGRSPQAFAPTRHQGGL